MLGVRSLGNILLFRGVERHEQRGLTGHILDHAWLHMAAPYVIAWPSQSALDNKKCLNIKCLMRER